MCTLSTVVVLQQSYIVCTSRDFRQSSHLGFEAASVSARVATLSADELKVFTWMNLNVPFGITSCCAGPAAWQVWTWKAFPQSVSACASCVSQLLCKSSYRVSQKNFLLSKLAAIGCNCMTSFHLAKLCSYPLPCWLSAFTSLTKFVDNWFEKNSYKNWCNWKVKVITMSSCHNRRLCSHVKRFTPCRSYGEKQTWDGAGYVVSMKEILT